MSASFVIGRMLFGGYFLYSGINHFLNSGTLAQYAASKDVPSPEAMVGASGAMLIFGGASMMLGVKPKLGALAVIGFLASVSPTIHDFWNAEDQGQRTNDTVNFAKNLALAGAALAVIGGECGSREQANVS
ncbi:MAG TPA: DoxX family protein [Bryobacteraceae bacterium]|nr:DoxX family protein [Bryobacteraceae bacterium]